jgi:hypothetical protein
MNNQYLHERLFQHAVNDSFDFKLNIWNLIKKIQSFSFISFFKTIKNLQKSFYCKLL